MHESSLSKRLLDAVLAVAAREGASRVLTVCGHLAETEALSTESLAFHFAAFARGTAAEGAELKLEVEHIQAECQSCGVVYLPDHHVTLCPACGATEAVLSGEPGVRIVSIDIDSSGDSAAPASGSRGA